MIAMMREPRMNRDLQSRRRFSADLCGPYACDAAAAQPVRCYLQIAGSDVAIDIPAEALENRRLGRSEIVLHLPGERVTLREAPRVTEKEQKAANGWSVEMEDFDRF